MVPEGPTIPGTGGESCVNPRCTWHPLQAPLSECVLCVLDFRPMLVISARILFFVLGFGRRIPLFSVRTVKDSRFSGWGGGGFTCVAPV